MVTSTSAFFDKPKKKDFFLGVALGRSTTSEQWHFDKLSASEWEIKNVKS
jgi:hypothetical protein